VTPNGTTRRFTAADQPCHPPPPTRREPRAGLGHGKIIMNETGESKMMTKQEIAKELDRLNQEELNQVAEAEWFESGRV